MPYADAEKNRECSRKSTARYRKRNLEKCRQASRDWQGKHPDYDRRWRYGLTQEKFESILHDEQHDLCAVCGLPFENSFDTCADHNHESEEFRGIVHRKCNRFISYVEDQSELIEMARRYLAKFRRA